MAYESYIFESNCCPTGEGLLTFSMVWHGCFPQTKRKLNHLHVAQIAQTGIQPVRGPARDGLTVFDENAAFLQCPDALWDALVAKEWSHLFPGPLRPLWAQSNLVLFGHALLEKLVYPRKPITAHVYRAQAATHLIADLDAWMAADLSAERPGQRALAHLPVLGVLTGGPAMMRTISTKTWRYFAPHAPS